MNLLTASESCLQFLLLRFSPTHPEIFEIFSKSCETNVTKDLKPLAKHLIHPSAASAQKNSLNNRNRVDVITFFRSFLQKFYCAAKQPR